MNINLDELRNNVAQQTGEPIERIGLQFVPFNARPLQGGVLVSITSTQHSWNARMTAEHFGINPEELSPGARHFWEHYRANHPLMRLIAREHGREPSQTIGKLKGVLSAWSFSTNMGGILHGYFVPFSAYAQFREAAGPLLEEFREAVYEVARMTGSWFRQAEPVHRAWAQHALSRIGLNGDMTVSLDGYIDRLRALLPTRSDVLTDYSLSYALTYIVGDPSLNEASDAITLFERDVLGKLISLLYNDVLDPVYKQLTGRGQLSQARQDRVRELLARVRVLNLMDNREVEGLAGAIEDAVRNAPTVTQQQAVERIQDIARVCRDNLESLALPAEDRVGVTGDVGPRFIRRIRRNLSLPEEPQVPVIRVEQAEDEAPVAERGDSP